MKLKYVAWKKVICSDVKRLTYGIQGPGVSNKGDQAIQNFNTLGENPGLWSGFTGGQVIPRKKEVERYNRDNGTDLPTTYDIVLQNSVNPLRLWEDRNEARKNPIKINHEIWDRSGNHAQNIIEIWYLGYMRILEELLTRLIERDGEDPNVVELREFVSNRLSDQSLTRENLLQWIYETQDGFNELSLDTSFLSDANLGSVKSFIENYFYIVAKCEDKGNEFNVALMARGNSAELHPLIRNLLSSSEKGGESVDIEMSHASYDIDVVRLQYLLAKKKNIILYGPPGTGKTHLLTKIAQSFTNSTIYDDFNTEAPFKIITGQENSLVEWCTFHPNYSYENFVLGLEPILLENNLGFKPHVGPLLKLAHAASKGTKSLLIIDEINRANTEDVFGNTLAIIDNSINNTECIKLSQEVQLDNGEVINSISGSDKLFIIGTMNSLDKSISPLSYELKRRFTIYEVSPNSDILRDYLMENSYIPVEVSEFCCSLMEYLNEKIRDYCGKEYTVGQGYFWDLVKAKEDYIEVLCDIISNKLLPHIRDIFPQEYFDELFGVENLNIIYESTDYGFELKNPNDLGKAQLINAMALSCGNEFRYLDNEEEDIITSFEEYENAKIDKIYEKLKRYTNVILAGCSGVGKSTIVNRIASENDFEAVEKMYWHSSTSYEDVIEGISAQAVENRIEYKLKDGAVKALANSNIEGNKLMIIENIDKGNASENFGELITLLEPDKRVGSYINGYDGYISLPKNMYFLCTMNPLSFSINHLDSALKRRFVIITLQPDYTMLKLWLNADDYVNQQINIDELYSLSERELKSLAIHMLRNINNNIKINLGADAQIGHAALWNLKDSCSVDDLVLCFDENIFPILEGILDDEEIAKRVLGNDSPLIQRFNHGVEILHMSKLLDEEIINAIKGIIGNA